MWAEREREVVSLISLSLEHITKKTKTRAHSNLFSIHFSAFMRASLLACFMAKEKHQKRDICFGFLLPPEKLLLAAAAVFKEEEKKEHGDNITERRKEKKEN